MRSLGIVLFFVALLAAPVLILVVFWRLFALKRWLRRERPELLHQFAGYGSYPASANNNLLLFIVHSEFEAVGGEVADRCRPLVGLFWITGAVMGCGALSVLMLSASS